MQPHDILRIAFSPYGRVLAVGESDWRSVRANEAQAPPRLKLWAVPPHPEETDDPEQLVYTTRGQALLLAQQTERVVAAGRPYCPRCHEPIFDFGHFCPPSNTRKGRHNEYVH